LTRLRPRVDIAFLSFAEVKAAAVIEIELRGLLLVNPRTPALAALW
jgi:hypothetical protein